MPEDMPERDAIVRAKGETDNSTSSGDTEDTDSSAIRNVSPEGKMPVAIKRKTLVRNISPTTSSGSGASNQTDVDPGVLCHEELYGQVRLIYLSARAILFRLLPLVRLSSRHHHHRCPVSDVVAAMFVWMA